MIEAEELSKRFTEQEFYNSHYMAVGVTPNRPYELVVYLYKKIRTDNLPQAFEGLKVSYKFHEAYATK